MYSIGLDIGKSSIEVYIPIKELNVTIKNDFKSLKSLYSKLKKYYKKDIEKMVFVYEPTGSYSTLLKRFCSDKSIKCFMVNPKKSSNFAKAIGQRGKSDTLDAKMLSKMIVTATAKDISIPIFNKVVEDLDMLISYYKLLIKQRTQNKNHLEAVNAKNPSSIIAKSLKSEIKTLNIKIDKCVENIKNTIQEDKKLYNTLLNLKTIKGVGDISAIVLLHHFMRYPDTNQKQIVSLAGLDPIEKTSGTSVKGKSRISKSGSKLCRGTLFMAAMTAIIHNEELKAFYRRLKDNGKHTTVAQIAVMRKIIIIAHSMYKNNEEYNDKRYLKNVA